MYSIETRRILAARGAYPVEDRNKLSIDELIDIKNFFEYVISLAEEEEEEIYSETYVYDDTKKRQYQDALSVILKTLKAKERLQRRIFGKNFFGPIPT